MQLRSGQQVDSLKKNSTEKHVCRFLTMKHILKDGNDEPKICYVCQSNIDITKNPDLLQCPNCNDVSHYQCIIKWFKNSANCPLCRGEPPLDKDNMPDILLLDENWQLNEYTSLQVYEAVYDSEDSEEEYVGRKRNARDSDDYDD